MKFWLKSKLLTSLFVFLFIVFAYSIPQLGIAAEKFVTIGTAGVTGVYYPTGGAICRLVNRGRRDHGLRCSVESTPGSIYNLNALRNGELDIAVAQSDWHYNAYKGAGPFEQNGPDETLRSLFSLHVEPFTVIARADSGITKFSDLVGKRVNIGNPGSGMRSTMDVIMKAKGWDSSSFKLVSELKASEQGQALCDNKIDVMIYAAGHPNGSVQEVTTTCDTKIIPVDDPEIAKLVDENAYFSWTVIPGGMYSNNPNDVKAIGVRATLVTSSKVPDDVIYEVVKAVFENFDSFRTLHPIFASLNAEQMIKEGSVAPLHPGAERYFREKGMIK